MRGLSPARTMLAVLVTAAATALGMMSAGCIPRPGHTPTANPTAGSDAEQVFQSLRDARQRAGKKPPTWVAQLAPIAEDGAQKVAEGGDCDVVTHDVANRAGYTLMKNVTTWWFVSDSLAFDWPARLLAADGLPVAIGVSLMATTAPGRHAILVVILEKGN